MRTPAQALLWELWRLSRWEMLFRVAGQCILWVVVFSFLEASLRELVAGIFLFLIIGSSLFTNLSLNGLDNKENSFPFYLGFTRPIATPLLVAGPMIYIALTSVLCFLIPATLIRVLFGIPYPLLPVAACMIAFCGCFVCAIWSPRSYVMRLSSMMSVGVAVVLALKIGTSLRPSLDPFLVFSPDDRPVYFAFSAPHYTVLFLVFAGAVVVTTFAVHRQRHGEALGIGAPLAILQAWADRLPRRGRPFGSAAQAQFWFEMRRSGMRVLLIGFAAASIGFLLVPLIRHQDVFEGKSGLLWLVILTLCLPVYQILGTEWVLGLKRKQGTTWMPAFDSTQAVESDRLVATKLAVVILSGFLSWLIMLCAAIAGTALLGDLQDLIDLYGALWPILAAVPLTGWAAAVIVAIGLYVGCSALLLTLGWSSVLYPRALGVFMGVVFAHMLLGFADLRSEWSLGPLWRAYGWSLSAALVGLTVWALMRSVKSGSDWKRYYVPAFLAWGVFVAAAVWLYVRHVPDSVTIPAPAVALGVAALTFPLTSVAAAPLALAAHRHR